jgi:hypothetical protein
MSGPTRQLLGPLRHNIQRMLGKCPQFTSSFATSNDREAFLIELVRFEDKLDRYFKQFIELRNKLLDFAQDDEEESKKVEDETDKNTQLFDKVTDALGDIKTNIIIIRSQKADDEEKRKNDALIAAAIGANTVQQQQQPNAQVAANPVQQQQPTAQVTSTGMKLYKLEPKTYAGDVMEWCAWWDWYSTAIHNNPKLSIIEKMNHLVSLLTGEAAASIKGVAVTEANYATTITKLTDRFGKPNIVIGAHYDAITNLPIAANSISGLRKFADQLESHMQQLSALDEDTDDNKYLLTVIQSKLPQAVRIKLDERNLDDIPWRVVTYRAALLNYLTAQETYDLQFRTSANYAKPTYESPSLKITNSSHTSTPSASARSTWTTTGALHSSDRTTNGTRHPKTNERKWSKPPPKCAFCGIKNDHYSSSCSKYTTADARKALLRDRCYKCLDVNHTTRDCTRSKPCWYCKRDTHHQSICPSQFSSSTTAYVSETTISPISSTNVHTSSEVALLASGESVLLATATVEVSSISGSHKITARLLFDSGSQRSYITETLAKKLNLQSTSTVSLLLSTFGATKPKPINSVIVPLRIKLNDGIYFTLNANVTPFITSGIHRELIDKSSIASLNRLVLADSLPTQADVIYTDLLIGSDYYNDFVLSTKFEVSSGLYCIDTTVGWIVQGRHSVTQQNANLQSATFFTYSTVDANTTLSLTAADDCLLDKFDPSYLWSLETVGILDKSDDAGDEEALQLFNKSICFKDGRYYVTWPWKSTDILLPVNYKLSLGRLNAQLNRYKDSPDIFMKYNDVIESQLRQGIIEKVDNSVQSTNRQHYIPHHAIITPDKTTTKLRIVYDGSAKSRKDNLSINECLYRGPIILDDICSLLIRFRFNKIALVADIEKAFLQIGLQETDRDVTRFLWLKDHTKLTTDNNLQIYRFVRVPFGIISSPFLLAATIDYHLRQSGHDVALRIIDNIYVDNIITGVNSIEEAIKFYQVAKQLFSTASLNLREWSSNSKEFIKQLPINDKTSGAIIKVLGITWDTQNDTLLFRSITDITCITKRTVLKFIASHFDPLGLTSPILLLAKIFLRKLWSANYSWDEVLNAEISLEWTTIAKSILSISDFSVPRFIGLNEQSDDVTYELHCFCDASANAYGICVYLRTITSTLSISHLIFAKSRVAPLKSISLPRLELTAVYIGSRILNFVTKCLRFTVSQKFIWTDSQCVLHWLVSKKLLTVFVRNRINAIKLFSGVTYLYVPTSENPADLASRGKTATELFMSLLWWSGPKWLAENNQSNWPKQNFLTDASVNNSICTEEIPTIIFETSLLTIGNNEKIFKTPFNIDLKRYSLLKKLLRVTAWCFRVVTRKQDKQKTIELTAKEINNAQTAWIKYIQKQYFADVFTALENKLKHTLVLQLDLFIDESEILRCGGRLSNAELSESEIHPILLPKNSHFTILVITDCHIRLKHVGVAHTLAFIRNEFWIPAGRSVVAKYIHSCYACKKYDSGPYTMPKMATLPINRVIASPPFTSTGLDYLGPLYIKTDNGSETKVWICLFTCLCTRAVHLELVDNMTAVEFLFCLRRFIAKRGKPSTIISDNAPQFKSVNSVTGKLWKNVVSDNMVVNYISDERITWSFIIERAPWMGGVYERLVRLVKQSLRKSLQKRRLTRTELATIIDEITAIINSRPLVYVGADFKSGFLLTPAHFLSPNIKTGTPNVSDDNLRDPDYVDRLSSKERLWEQWVKHQNLLKQYWKVWYNDYLKNLRERKQYHLQQPHNRSHDTPNIGDIVLVFNDGPRGSWQLAKIIDLIKSTDNQIRSAKIRVPSGAIWKRALSQLYPLECGNSDGTNNFPDNTSILDEKIINNKRPVRDAAKGANIRMQIIADTENEHSF